MSRQNLSLVERPPQASPHSGDVRKSWRASLILGSALLLLAGSVFAQDSPRIDPGSPPPIATGTAEGWQIFDIPGLPEGAMLGDVWVSPSGVVYVWAKYPPSVRANTIEDPVEGERLPNPPGTSKSWSSNLYRYDGMQWSVTLRTIGEVGVALLGSGDTDLFASTISEQGEARLYHWSGGVWSQEVLPGHFRGERHTLVGVPDDLFFRVDRTLLRHDGMHVQSVIELPFDTTPMRGMVYLNDDCLFAMTSNGHYLYHNGMWQEVPAGFDFSHVEDAWGMRDADGRLHMYASGDDGDDSGIKVWKYNENDPSIHDGVWVPVLLDPMSGHTPGIGSGLHLWGAAGNDVYATGVVSGEGHMMRFNGTSWTQLNAPRTFGTVHGVWGTASGVVWFSTEAGQLVRYQRGNDVPDVSAAIPSVTRLWPDDGRFVAVDVLGVRDPDGDPFTLTIDRVLSDENPVNVDVMGFCPDARIAGTRVMLRAEHAPGGDGRTYVIEFTATDRLGMSSTGHVHVCAPHYLSTPCDVDAAVYDAEGPCAVPGTGRRPFDADDRNGALQVRYELEQAGPVHLGIYDVAGRLRGTIEEGERAAGVHETSWNLSALDAGVYFVKLRRGDMAQTKRVVVLH